MLAYIVTTLVGVFGVDERKKIVAYNKFEKDVGKTAEKLKLSEIRIIDEEKQVIDQLGKRGFRKFIFSNRKPGAKHFELHNIGEQFVKENLRELAVDYKFVKDQIEFNQFLTKVNLELTKVKIKLAFSRDSLIMHANNAIEELDKSINIFVERLREWYGLHFPEMDRVIENHEKFVKLVKEFGDRSNISEIGLSQLAEKSIGANFTSDDINIIQEFSNKITELYKVREEMSQYLEKLLHEIAPNFTELAGPMLAAKLITKAGGLEKLARMPSSTVQLLGAEKALFRFLHSRDKGAKSPRFGILFSHPMVQNSPEKLKGKIARIIASKLSMAAKIDFYSKEYKGKKMKDELEERVKSVSSSK